MGVRSEVGGECEAGGTFYSNWSVIFEYAALPHRRRPNRKYVKNSLVRVRWGEGCGCGG